MARTRVAKLAFNRGLVSRLGLARADIKRLAMAAEVQTNFTTRVLGSMMLRQGWGHLGSSRNDAQAFHIPFVFAANDKANIELTNLGMRVWVDDAVITRPAVSTAVTNGEFTTDLTGWTDNDEAGTVSQWGSLNGTGHMFLAGSSSNTGNSAIRDQQVTVAASDQNVEHALHIVVTRGIPVLRVGSTSGGDEYVSEAALGVGSHSFAFTPTGDFHIRFKYALRHSAAIERCVVESAGAMVVEAPWATADLRKIRFDQSGDVIFVACATSYQQRRIERHGTRSWSCVRYQAEDGPFRVQNTSGIKLSLSTGILTASAPFFKSTQAPSTNNDGAIFRIPSVGQVVSDSILASDDTFTDPILVEGVGTDRTFTYVITEDAAGAATFTIQRAPTRDGPWADVQSFTASATASITDGFDNQTLWYRIGIKEGGYTNGTHVVQLSINGGSLDEVVRVTSFTSTTAVDCETLKRGSANMAIPVADWSEGEWSDRRGWPSAVTFHDGRLNWDGKDAVQLSISDAFDSFDEDFEGDAGPINRTIGSGPVDNIHWALSLQRLLLGGEGAEFSVRSSSLDEPLTPTTFNLKRASGQGSAPVAAVLIDQSGAFVQRGGTRVYEVSFGGDGIDYTATHLSVLKPEIGQPGIVKLLVQRQPDTRLHALRSDGTVAMLVFDKAEQVICWLELETDGEVEDGVILPGDAGDEEDHVYYSVKRTINGATKRFFEKWAFESECGNLTLNKQADCFITYSQAASSTIGGLTHLVGESVVVWDNGKCLRDTAGDIATFVVSGAGEITVTNAGAAYQATQGVAGLPYTASWKSAKLVELMNELGGSLTDAQIIKGLALILADVHHKGLKFGQSLTEAEMNDLPEVRDGAPVAADTVTSDYTTEKLTFPGSWSKDARLCLLAKAPRPCTVLAALAEVEHHG